MKRIEEGLECDYKFEAADRDRTCDRCRHYHPLDDGKGTCYEYEVVPSGGCKFFEPKDFA